MTRILIVDDDQDIARILRFRLQKKGFECVLAANGVEALEKIDTHHPDLVLLDVMMPKMDGFTACREIRKRNAWCRVPVIMLTAKGDIADKVIGIGEGADDYIVKPFEFEELLARVQMILRRTQETMSANPLTGLPGNNIISKKIEATIAAGTPFAACYADLDHFKAYNDEYGFEAGDKVIKFLAEVLLGVTRETAPDAFVGHIGGDDFLFLVSLDTFEACCERVIQRFDAGIAQFYRDEHVRSGFLESINRQGQRMRFPLMSLSIGVVTNGQRALGDAMQVSNRAAEMKKYAKGQPGSCYRVDRRTVGAGPGQEDAEAAAGRGDSVDAQGAAGGGR